MLSFTSERELFIFTKQKPRKTIPSSEPFGVKSLRVTEIMVLWELLSNTTCHLRPWVVKLEYSSTPTEPFEKSEFWDFINNSILLILILIRRKERFNNWRSCFFFNVRLKNIKYKILSYLFFYILNLYYIWLFSSFFLLSFEYFCLN